MYQSKKVPWSILEVLKEYTVDDVGKQPVSRSFKYFNTKKCVNFSENFRFLLSCCNSSKIVC